MLHLKKTQRKFILGVLIVAVLGVAFVLITNAATSNFEAESSTKAGGVTSGTDTSASNGQYAKFSSSASGASSVQRFPGDPNPKVTGKAYWGASELEATTYKSRFEDPTGKSMSTVRRFWSSWGQRGSLASQAKNDLAANRLPMYSIKPVGWTEMASGSRDSEIDALLRDLDNVGSPIWLIIHHEPDGGGSKLGPKNEDDPAGAAGWVKMQKKFRERMNAIGTKNVALMAAMTGGFGGDLNQPKDNWWADNTFDAFLLDHYTYSLTDQVANHRYWKGFYQWAESKGIPYGTAELGIRSGGQDGVGYYLPTSDCSQLVPRGISADLDQSAGNRLQEFWDWGFNNNKDVIAHEYFDKCVNSGDSPYAMGGKQLEVFRNILKSDSRVMRVNDLAANTQSNYGTMTSSVSVPASGTYKVWVRINAPDATNNSVGLQVDNGSTIKVGDASIPANTWTWADYKDGSTSSKTTISLTSGAHTFKLLGLEPNVKIDRVIVTDESCIPSGNGDNCVTSVPPSTDEISITSLSDGQTVKGTVNVVAEPATGINDVNYLVNGTWQSTDSTAPFSWPWDTTKVPDGTATVTIRARGPATPSGSYIEKTVTVTVSNASAPPTARQCDFNGDNQVNLSDLAMLLSGYGKAVTANSNGDCDGDGTVNLADLAKLLSLYGQ